MEDYSYKLPAANLGEASQFKVFGQFSRTFVPDLIQEYSRRQLSYPCDILKAFAGFADMLTNECGFDLCYGLIRSTLTYSMMWKSRNLFLSRRAAFPSWSWCGWIGEVVAHSKVLDPPKWTRRFSWIHWYLFDIEKNHFYLLPQQEWQLGDTELDVMGSEDYEINYARRVAEVLNSLGAPLPDAEFVHSEFENRPVFSSWTYGKKSPYNKAQGTNTNACDGSPQYLEFLRKHNRLDSGFAEDGDPDHPRPPPSIRGRQSIQGTHSATMTSHTLYFRTLTKTVCLSAYDPHAHARVHMHQCAHIYDVSNQYLGIAWLDHVDLFCSAFGIVKPTDGRWTTKPKTTWFPIHMAVLSGPTSAVLGSAKFFWTSSPTSAGAAAERAGESLKFYQVMLLTRRIPPTYDVSGDQGAYERAGLGEIAADAMESLDGLEWSDIILQ
jgi:hypothetical protein